MHIIIGFVCAIIANIAVIVYGLSVLFEDIGNNQAD